MLQTINLFQGRGLQINTSNGYVVSIGIGGGHYCDNEHLPISTKLDHTHTTSTMEVAILRENGGFVCLPYDVAGHVPVCNLGEIIVAVEANDWKRVCFLCEQDDKEATEREAQAAEADSKPLPPMTEADWQVVYQDKMRQEGDDYGQDYYDE